MANWKHIGEVPDSEDDEDLDFDSQTVARDDETKRRQQELCDSSQALHDVDDEQGARGGYKHNNEPRETTPVEETDIAMDKAPTPTTTIQEPQTYIAANSIHSRSPSISPRIFKIPRGLLEHDAQFHRDSASEALVPNMLSDDSPEEDDISRSYVRITSSNESPLSSPPSSQVLEHAMGNRSASEVPSHSSSARESALQQSILAGGNLGDFARRSMRQRNPIQLHPYMVEQEKYRRTLKSRGMTPMRLASTQDESQPESGDPASLDADSNDAEPDTGESQSMDVDWSLDASSPPQGSLTATNHGDVLNELPTLTGDDEFPDIHELLEMPKISHRDVGSKRARKSYSSKHKQLQLSKIRDQSSRSNYHNQTSTSIFDVLASPPATSSPFMPPSRDSRSSMPHAVSVSSKDATTPTGPEQDQSEFHIPADLPTPVTSALKPLIDASVLVHSDTDSDDPFATDADSSPSASSDESVRIWKVGKKIRGVLPASHLRIDQPNYRPRLSSYTRSGSTEVSPGRPPIRRGVAMPKPPVIGENPPMSTSGEIAFLSSDSDDGENEIYPGGFAAEANSGTELDELFDPQRQGFAEEDDTVDAMLPPSKRQRRTLDSRPKKRRRLGTGSNKYSRSHPRQPRITEHPRQPKQAYKPSRRAQTQHRGILPKSRSGPSKPWRDIAPRLSIMDAINLDGHKPEQLPQFIRIAARTSRSWSGQGKQSPSEKYIKLANRKDTFEAQSVLNDWRRGKIQPNAPETYRAGSADMSRPPLHRITNNRQRREPLLTKDSKLPSRTQSSQAGMPRTLLISRTRQRSINALLSANKPTPQQRIPSAVEIGGENPPNMRPEKPRHSSLRTMPAQLEAPELECPHVNPASTFGTTKKSLDALYRTSRKRRGPQANPQLGRFLSSYSTVQPTGQPHASSNDPMINSLTTTKQPLAKIFRRKKTLPKHVDVGAAIYRQPSEPLVLELLSPHLHNAVNEDNKLQGLGKYGTKYPIHFDIFPLHSGTYFHDTTFIGSGLLAEVLNGTSLQHDATRPRMQLTLHSKDFQWDSWNEIVSSEIGFCFDWVADQLLLQPSLDLSSPTTDPITVITFIINYVQHHLSFSVPRDREDFLGRMSDIFRDFLVRLSRENYISQQQGTDWAGVLARCTALIFQLLQIARTIPEQASLSYELEDSMKAVACMAASLLVSHGLDVVRTLYDDLQYLSFRESGIKNDQYTAQSWVILMKVLDAAQIPRGSFWDVANRVLIDVDLPHISDARAFEKLWYSMFSLLPLCEIDEFGIVQPGRRQKVAFDNWSYPQQILKRIFELYSLNPRQSLGFNDYCRAILGRCHYLMAEWGWWKCTGLIGTVFDIFASHKLAHLRNEEVYSSPRFLVELDQEPSLIVEPEDRCFHIFLKIVGSAIKHMCRNQNTKAIRNLVARLLPNHDRQYPKEETIHHRELASLRNHHDLLCTLYWAAPAEQRPSPSLIQDLVLADRSHNEACLINLKSWENLTRFIVATSTNVAIYRPFTVWQNAFSVALSQQYLDTEQEVRRQAEVLAIVAKEPISEVRLQNTIASNKRSSMEMLRAIVKAMDHTVMAAKSGQMAIQALNPQLLSRVCFPDLSDDPNFQSGILRDCIRIICHYTEQIDRLEPIPPPPDQATCSTDAESQGSLDMNLGLDRVEMIYRLQPEVLPLLRNIISKSLQDRSRLPHTVLADLVSCWACVTVKLTEGAMNLKEFLISGPNAVFQHRQSSKRANAYWPLFLNLLVEHKTLDDFKISRFDIGVEWLKALSMPQLEGPTVADTVNTLTAKLQSKGFCLSISPRQLGSGVGSSPISLGTSVVSNHILFKNAVDVMRASLANQANMSMVFKDVSQREALNVFATMLKDVMDSIKHHLESMIPGSEQHREYVEFIQPIASVIRSYGSDILPLSDFFVHSSTYYWPEDTDPNLYAAGIVSYSLRLIKQPGRTSPELFHYLYNGWRKDLAQSSVEQHIKYLKKGMSRWEFTVFLLSDFIPAALHVGFESTAGWALCATYLPALSRRVGILLQKRNTKADLTFQCVINILKIILNGIQILYLRTGNNDTVGSTSHQRIIGVVSQFWLSLALPINQYADPYPDKNSSIRFVGTALTKFICYASRIRNTDSGSDDLRIGQFEVNMGENFERFVSVLTQDIHGHWEVNSDGSELIISGARAREKSKTRVDLNSMLGEPQPLWQMLNVALPYLESFVDEPLPVAMEKSPDPIIPNIYF
ncbi:uncharacterized protein BP5553_00288 [Venustampulla echinocandica]|uniref:Uncharacterized protein n=1 Tax=Venustampulla echinocandica TaxID=2656787 RepID=A0A370TXR2_9HELO|nr:uncharacterized protein BP5553_00288 [Venustampulla echinocandica]RDL40309.1 hypothetical protein BP5553_00288 [Venustampulla echinocandica]